MLKATIEKEWGEVRRKGRGKVEDWSWGVAFHDSSRAVTDFHWYITEADAKMVAALFETGDFHYGEYGEVVINNVFESED